MNSFLANFLRFSRLHTIIGTTLSIFCLYLVALGQSMESQMNAPLLGWTLLSCLAANVYIVGLNQLTDVEIDKINKPYLPLASGAFSRGLGVRIVVICLVLCLSIAIAMGDYLLLTVLLSLAIGTAYSLPPIRLKRFPFWAAFSIIAVRGLVVNLLLFLHFDLHLNDHAHIPREIYLLTAIIFLYSVIIAWFKDIPDMEGDRKHEIDTLSLRLGANRIFLVGNLILFAGCVSLILYVFFQFTGGFRTGLIGAHVFIILALVVMMFRTKPRERKSMARYYQFIWILFFSEYLLFGLLSL